MGLANLNRKFKDFYVVKVYMYFVEDANMIRTRFRPEFCCDYLNSCYYFVKFCGKCHNEDVSCFIL